ncbi:MAG: glycoside hydrolase family 125 protein [Candidatus Eremiobacteraeota bacterium]|nr:glycoside hydrolase family 125 protein [Candidatus Eremiobacteraeota bacterium]
MTVKMVSARLGAIFLTLNLAFASIPAVASPKVDGPPPERAAAVAVTLQRLYQTAYDEAYSRHAVIQADGTTFVSTGDIDAEWLRDSSAVVKPYIGLAMTDPEVGRTLRGVIVRQARYMLLDPYANAFTLNYRVSERKFEMDSLLYPIWFSYLYWKASGDRSIFTPQVQRAFHRAMEVLRTEQHHANRSKYRHPQLANGGQGSPVGYTGLVWTAFRPSDDPARYQYNIPDNMFAVTVLRELTDIERSVYHDERTAQNAWGLGAEIQRAIEQYGQVNLPGFGRIYAYEVDGRGHANLMDDANIPSLLSIPYFGYVGAHDSVYRATRSFVLSDRNPFYYQGKFASGIGSPHTPHGYIWPLSLVMQALTSTDQTEIGHVLNYIAASDIGDHRLHESFNANWPEAYTRDDFAWPNALFAELMISHQGLIPAFMESARNQPTK